MARPPSLLLPPPALAQETVKSGAITGRVAFAKPWSKPILQGAIYAVRVPVLIEQQTFLPPRTYGHPVEPGVNIDREEDFLFLETLVKSGRVRLHGIKED